MMYQKLSLEKIAPRVKASWIMTPQLVPDSGTTPRNTSTAWKLIAAVTARMKLIVMHDQLHPSGDCRDELPGRAGVPGRGTAVGNQLGRHDPACLYPWRDLFQR